MPRLCSLVLPGMRKRGWGRIVAINSVSTRQPIPGLALSNFTSTVIDKGIIDGAVTGIGVAVRAGGDQVRKLQDGFQPDAELAPNIDSGFITGGYVGL